MATFGQFFVHRQAPTPSLGHQLTAFPTEEEFTRGHELPSRRQVVRPLHRGAPPRPIPRAHPGASKLMTKAHPQGMVAHVRFPARGRRPAPAHGPTALLRPLPTRPPLPGDRQSRNGVQRLGQPKVHQPLVPTPHVLRRGAQLTFRRPRPIGGQLLAHIDHQPRLAQGRSCQGPQRPCDEGQPHAVKGP